MLADNSELELLILAAACKARKEKKFDLRYVLAESIKTDESASKIRFAFKTFLNGD